MMMKVKRTKRSFFFLQIVFLFVVILGSVSAQLVPVLESLPPQPYAYQYGVRDDLSGNF